MPATHVVPRGGFRHALFRGASRASMALAAAGALIGGLAGPAWSQGAPPEQGVERVVVTARYREENLQETPLAITAVSAEGLEARSFANIADVAAIVPNASFRQSQAAFGRSTTAFIRGVGQSDFDIAFEPGVAFYLDGVYHPLLIGSVFDLFDLERVEVLRGPQGTLFGRGAVGGAVNLVAKPPLGANDGYIEATYGEFDRVDLRAGYDLGLAHNLFMRVSGVSKHREGYQDIVDFVCAMNAAGTPELAGSLPGPALDRLTDGCKVGTAGGEDYQAARVSLRYEPLDNLDITLNADYTDDSSEVQANYLLDVDPAASDAWNDLQEAAYGVRLDERFLTGDPFVSYATWRDPEGDPSGPGSPLVDFEPLSTVEGEGVSLVTNYGLTDDITATLILAAREYNVYFANDHDATPLGYQTVDGRVHHEQTTAELRLTGTSLDRLDWTVGAFYYDAQSIAAQVVDLAFLGFGLNTYNVNNPTHTAGFANVVFHVNDMISVNGGVRYSNDEKFFDFDNTIVQAERDISDESFDWRAGLDLQLTDEVLVYGSASTGYRPPAFNSRPFQPSQFVAVDGEELTAYEVGVKGDYLDNRVRLNLAAFYSDYSQRIVPQGGVEPLLDGNGDPIPDETTPDPNDFVMISRTFYVNTPATITGFEAELDAEPIENLTVVGSVGYAKPEAEDDVIFTFVPEWTASVGVQYDIPLPDGALSPRLDYFYTDDITFSNITGIKQDGYGVANARLAYEADNDWAVALSVTNLTDEVYNLNIFDLQGFGQATVEAQPGRPREWAITATRRF